MTLAEMVLNGELVVEPVTSGEVNRMIKWIRGLDQIGMRSRRVPENLGWGGRSHEITWRLGDIEHSTPVSVSEPSEAYHLTYKDLSYAKFFQHYKNILKRNYS